MKQRAVTPSRTGARDAPEVRDAPERRTVAPAASGPPPWLWILALVALVFFAFRPALSAEFLFWDDEQNITSNHAFRGLDLAHLRWMFTTDHMGPYQPLAWLSLAVDHALWGLGGPDAFPEAPHYHATNVLLHALTAAAFFLLARRLLARVFSRSPRELALPAFVAAAFFAVHPLRVESVAWVTERRDVLSGLFYVLAASAWLAYAEARGGLEIGSRRLALAVGASLAAMGALGLALDLSDPQVLALRSGGAVGLVAGLALLVLGGFAVANGSRRAFGAYTAVIALFLAALLSKGLVLVLPGVLLVADIWPLRRVRDARTLVAAVIEKLPLLALAGVFARIAFWGQQWIPGLMASWTDHTLGERVLQAFFGLAFYVRKTILPLGLSPLYELPASLRLSDPRYLLSIGAVVAGTAVLVLCRRRAPALLAAFSAYAIAVAPVLGFSQAGPQIAADRYTYLACLPFALLAGAAVARWRGLSEPGSTAARAAKIATGAALAVLAVLAGLTYAQARVWQTSAALWERAIALDPDAVLNNLNLGHVRVRQAERSPDGGDQQRRLDEAQKSFERGLELREDPLLYAGLALVHQHRWELDPKHGAAEADLSLDFARRALALARQRNIETPDYHLNLGSALGNAQHPNDALAEFQSFVRDRPNSYLGHYLLGFALLQASRFSESVRELGKAVELEPRSVNAWGNLGLAQEKLGERDLAIRCYQRVLELKPGHPTAKQHLFMLQSRMSVDVVPNK